MLNFTTRRSLFWALVALQIQFPSLECNILALPIITSTCFSTAQYICANSPLKLQGVITLWTLFLPSQAPLASEHNQWTLFWPLSHQGVPLHIYTSPQRAKLVVTQSYLLYYIHSTPHISARDWRSTAVQKDQPSHSLSLNQSESLVFSFSTATFLLLHSCPFVTSPPYTREPFTLPVSL